MADSRECKILWSSFQLGRNVFTAVLLEDELGAICNVGQVSGKPIAEAIASSLFRYHESLKCE